MAKKAPGKARKADGDAQPDEEALLADVSSILDPLVRLGEPAPAAGSPSLPPPAADSAALAAQLMARQHAEYQRSVELVRQQLAHRHMQQMQHTQQQHLRQLAYQQHHVGGDGSSPTTSPNATVMQHIQQRLQERIHNKQHQQLYEQMRAQAVGASPESAQIQQYHTLIRELEMQAAAATPTTTTAPGMSQEELERVRQERLQRLHQLQLQNMQQHMQAQHAAALRVTLTGVPPAAPLELPHAQMHVDLERLRQLQQQKQHPQPSEPTQPPASKPVETLAKPQAPKPKATKASKATPKKRTVDQVAATEKEVKVENGGVATLRTAPTTPAAEEASAAAVAEEPPSVAATVPPPKKKRKTPVESQMEALVRVLCRLHLSKNESEMRTQLDKFTTWIGKCADLCLLRFALRDFIDIFGIKQKQFEKSVQWPTELLPKCTFTHDKLRHVIAALVQANAAKVGQSVKPPEPSAMSSPAPSAPSEATEATPADQDATTVPAQASGGVKPAHKTKSAMEVDAVTLAAREHAYAALKEQMMANLLQPKPRPTPAAKVVSQSGTAAAAGPSVSSGSDAPGVELKADAAEEKSSATKKKRDLSIDVNAGVAVKAANPTSDPTGPSSEVQSTTTAVKPVPVVRPAPPPTPMSTVISPRVAQHLFDLELAPRACVVAPDEGEDRFYIPVKPIANIMRKVLPGGGPTTVRRRRKKRSNAADNENIGGDAVTKKKNDDEDDEDEDGDDGDGDGAGDDGDENEPRDGDDDDEIKGEKELEPAAANGLPQPVLSSVLEEPPVKIDDDALTFMQECVTEFMLFFTSEARDQSAYDKKKGSISGFNIINAMENLGFSPYAKVLANYNDKVRKVQDEAAHVKQERKNLAKARKLQAQLQQLEAEKAKQAEAAAAAAAGGATGQVVETANPPASTQTAPVQPTDVDEPMALAPPDPLLPV